MITIQIELKRFRRV